MAIYHQDIADIELNSGSLHRSFLGHSIGMGDAAANRFGVRVFRDGVAETLSGVTCQGFFRNANGENIALTSYGTIDGNVAYVTLPQACYNVEGRFTLAIKLVGGGVTGTMRIVDGMVDNTNTGSAVAPTGSVPTYQEILSVYEQMQTAVTNYDAKVAEQDAKISDLKRTFAKTIDPLFPEGEYITSFNLGKYYDSNLQLQDNAASAYIGDVPCSGYEKIVISTPNMLVSNATRCVGLKKNGAISAVYTIQSLVPRCTRVGDHYETEIMIGEGDTLFFSIQSDNIPNNITLSTRKSIKLLNDVESNAKNIADIENYKISNVYNSEEHIHEFKLGYYYDVSLTPVENSSSAYLDPVNCSGYSHVIIKTNSPIASNSARHIGIKKENEIIAVYTLQSIVSWCEWVEDHYETAIPTGGGDEFYFSIQSNNIPFEISFTPNVFVRNVQYYSYRTVYVSTTGNDHNTGEDREHAMRTIQAAIDSGARVILVKEGEYAPFSIFEKDGITVSLDPYYSAYTAGTDEDNPKIIINSRDNSIGINLNRCNNCKFIDIEVRNAPGIGFRVYRCSGCEFISCIAHNIGISSSESNIAGFMIQYSNANFYKCAAYNIGTTTAGAGLYHYDGFNIHYTGTTNFYDCSAWNCEDDGISHHDACRGLIDGGEWYNCGKGGIASPTHGAVVDVSNAYSHNNAYGIYCDTTGSTITVNRPAITITNCALKNNSSKDLLIGDFYHACVWSCIYDTAEIGSNTVIME